LQHGTDAPDDSGRALIVSNDIAEDLAKFLQVHGIRSQETLRGLGVAQDSCERLVELVNQGRKD
jgi:hypothetical protein